MTMRIGFQTFTRPLWMAGIVALHDLMAALRTLGPGRPWIDLVQWEGAETEGAELLTPLTDRIITARFPLPENPRSLNGRTWRNRLQNRWPRMSGKNPPRARDETLRLAGVDCVFSVPFERRSDLSVPLLVWIYDLQHHHLPDLIHPAHRRERDAVITAEAGRATRLLVQSKSVREDITRFFPEFADKTSNLTWVSDIPPAIYDADPAVVLARYHLPCKFFYLPNQFWQHKNHRLVIEALDRLSQRGVEPVVVCTGSVHDHRNPDYFGSLMQAVSVRNLRAHFLVLGTIPRADVFLLMRQSIAVVNSSLFEGFGLSTAEAKSLGARTLVSDLPPLREQDAPGAVYFDPHAAEDLAAKMEMLWQTIPAGPDAHLETAARAALPARQRVFGEGFMQIAEQAIRDFRAPNSNAERAAAARHD